MIRKSKLVGEKYNKLICKMEFLRENIQTGKVMFIQENNRTTLVSNVDRCSGEC